MPTLSSTGKDITVNLTIAGVRVDECAAIDFSEAPRYDNIEVKPLGKDYTETDRSFNGWGGTITFVERDARLQALVNAYNLAIRQRLPVVLSITRTINYRDGTSNTQTYTEVFIDWESRYRRGEANQVTINWQTGRDRI